ncbi:MAG TPA: hypothetical protein VFN55_11055 [Solirubrobacteraceae bacterium]|nr:hypothetical protein [Solirubrobacteraceae bacterium]
MTIEVLYFDGCPNHEALLPRLRELMRKAAVQAPIELVRIESDAAAQSAGFLGSPTVRINGEDVEPGASRRTDFGLKCRLYATPEGIRGSIPDDLLASALACRAGR